MDTKLKNIPKSLVLLVTCALLMASVIFTFAVMSEVMVTSEEVLTVNQYEDSERIVLDLYGKADQIVRLHKFYQNEDHIKNNLDYELNVYDLPYDLRKTYDIFVKVNVLEGNIDVTDYYYHQPTKNAFKAAYAEELKSYYQNASEDNIQDFITLTSELSGRDGVHYLYLNDEVQYSNIDEFNKDYYENHKVFYRFNENGERTSIKGPKYVSYDDLETLNFNDSDELYVAFSANYLKDRGVQWENESQSSKIVVGILLLELLLLVIVIIRLWYSIKDKELSWIKNKMFFDVYILMVISLMTVLFTVFSDRVLINYYPLIAFVALITGSLVSISIVVLKKHWNQKQVLKHTLIYFVLAFFGMLLIRIISSAPIAIRMLPSMKNTKDFKQALVGVEALKEGDFEYEVEPISSGLYKQLAMDINQVKNGMKLAVDNELKSERLKSELITNVSHDIRTPLTSIINYVDLLKSEKDEVKRSEFLEVLESKSQRLKVLIEDLFDAAKVASGSVSIDIESVNIQALLHQCLGEMDSTIQSKGLEMILNCTTSDLLGDRNAMWRVMDNLLSNITKYALDSSRVYIEAVDEEEYVVMTFKNISAHPLNIPVEELMTRFTRGEASRHSEGSGLGLSISEDLINIQKGSFELTIDGDLFKVIIKMPKQTD